MPETFEKSAGHRATSAAFSDQLGSAARIAEVAAEQVAKASERLREADGRVLVRSAVDWGGRNKRAVTLAAGAVAALGMWQFFESRSGASGS